jgi:hypothetical protein
MSLTSACPSTPWTYRSTPVVRRKYSTVSYTAPGHLLRTNKRLTTTPGFAITTAPLILAHHLHAPAIAHHPVQVVGAVDAVEAEQVDVPAIQVGQRRL